jgi:hypothetical protein
VRLVLVVGSVVLASAACANGPSPRWQTGGAAIPVDAAYLARSSSTIELRPSGDVMQDDTLLFRVDRQGRVSDAEGRPVAVLGADGWLVAESDGAPLGFIRPGSASNASQTEWIRILPTGEASVAGTRLGKWDYCTGAMLRTCTLVTHVIAARELDQRPDSDARDALSLLELLRLAK